MSVALVGVLCGTLDGGVAWALTGSLLLGLVVGVPTAAILVVLGVVGARQRAASPAARAAHEARLARQRQVIEAAGTGGDRPA